MFESLLLLHEFDVGLMNTLTVTLAKLGVIVFLRGMTVQFFVCPTSEENLKLVTI